MKAVLVAFVVLGCSSAETTTPASSDAGTCEPAAALKAQCPSGAPFVCTSDEALADLVDHGCTHGTSLAIRLACCK